MQPIPRNAVGLVLASACVAATIGACSSGGTGTNSATSLPPSSVSSTASATAATSSASASSVVGRWEQRHSCQQLLTALRANGLEKVAPAFEGDFFPNTSPQQLAEKGSHICDGAVPQVHAHFLTSTGSFGSLDQDGQQVDDGKYQVVSSDVIQVNHGRFRYTVTDGALVLTPLISAKDRKAAPAAPNDFSTAGWQVAVTYNGLP